MSLRITFDIFSGRPNPEIVLDGKDASAFLDQLQGTVVTDKAAAEFAGQQELRLGYRGIVVEQIGPSQAGLGVRFRIARSNLISASSVRQLSSSGVEETLLANANRLRDAGISEDLATLIKSEVAAAKSQQNKTFASQASTKGSGPSKLLKCTCAPIYEPNWWNDAATGGARQYHNNCYNYACNYRTDTYAQPGRAGGTHMTSITCAGIKPAVLSDALVSYSPSPAVGLKCPDRGNLIAFAVWPNWDFHCYRLDNNGFWTHKPGSNPVTNLDNSGHVITDPRTADRGRYTDFCSFLVVMDGHIKLQ